MALRRLRKIARKVRQRMAVQDASSGTPSFDWTQDRAFAYLDEDADAAFKLIGAALVGTWEVTITDVARSLDQRLPEDKRVWLVGRISDGLVPTQGPLQETGRQFRSAIKEGLQVALRSKQLSDATTPLTTTLQALPAAIEQGWGKTTEYLDPVFEMLPEPDALKTRFASAGPALRTMVEGHNSRFEQDMRELSSKPDLRVALTDALEVWRLGIAAGIELLVYAQRTTLVEGAGQLPLISDPGS